MHVGTVPAAASAAPNMVGNNHAIVIGLTGNIACGKSIVLRMLAKLGAATIDADVVYHELIAPNAPLWHRLRSHFGEHIIAPDGQIDRRALGAIVFADPAALTDLDRLTHPAVIAEVRRRITSVTRPIVVVDAVKLVESGLVDLCDELWVVRCEPAQQLSRLIARNGLTEAEAAQRIAAQPPLAPKLARADVVIDNSGGLDATRAQIAAAWQRIATYERG
jgi:dephospho-CoA kinase